MSRDDPKVSGNSVAEFDVDHIPDHQLLGVDIQLLAVADDQRELQSFKPK